MTEKNTTPKPKAKFAKTNSVLAVEACPEIRNWLDDEKNEGLDIYSVTAGSKQKVHLKCPKCGEPMYKAMYSLLTKNEDGTYQAPVCRKCAPVVHKKKTTLLDAVPDIETYWDYGLNDDQSPSDFSAVASNKVWTKCPICGTSVRRNVRYTWAMGEDGVGHVIHCRTCGKRRQDNSLTALFPEIKDYWCFDKNEHPPEHYTISSGKKIYIRCPDCGRERHVAVCDVVCKDSNGNYRISSCDECANEKTLDLRRQGDSNIAKACPNINLYWDEKNILQPDKLTLFSTEKIYTHCPTCGCLLYRRAYNSFEKVNGTWNVLRCQTCAAMQSNRERAMATRGSVLSECPEIQDWWDYDRNDMSPENLTRGSHYEAYLNCPACKTSFRRDIHSFVATHRDGRILPVACPQCGFSSKGNPEDNLVKVCPDIVNWWDYDANAPFLPEQFSKGSTYVAHLKCPDCGLELYTGIHSLLRTDDTGNVVISHAGRCRKYKAMNSPNNLVTNYPQIKRWWNYDKNAPALPEEYTIFSPFKAHFKCPDCGAESYMRITDAFSFNAEGIPKIFKCAFCAGTRPIPHVNSLAALYPELAAECISVFDTENVFPNSSSRVKWQCHDCGGQWFGLIVNRVNGQKCPYCEGKRLIPGFNSLDVINPELAAEWAPSNTSKPRDFLSDSCNIAIWKCPKCHGEYKARIRDREVGDDSCPYCSGKRVNPGVNSLDVINPELAAEWAPSNVSRPSEFLPTSSYTVIWQCPTCHGEYSARIRDREVGDGSCPYCREKVPLPGYNTVKAKHPNLIEHEWATLENTFIGVDSDKILDNSTAKAWWKCPICNHLYVMSVKDRLMKEKRGHNACTFCSGRRIPSPRIIL